MGLPKCIDNYKDNCEGTFIYSNSQKYVGSWKNDKKWTGIYFSASGDKKYYLEGEAVYKSKYIANKLLLDLPIIVWILWSILCFFITKRIAGYKGWGLNKPTLKPKIYPKHNGRIYFAFYLYAALISTFVWGHYDIAEMIFRFSLILPGGLVAYFFGYFIRYLKKDNHSFSKEIYAAALSEFENNRDEQLWTKYFAESDGDESKAKARYLKDRAEILSEEDENKVNRNPSLNKLSDEEREKIYQSVQDYKDGKL